MAVYILQYTDAEGIVIRFEIEAHTDQAAYNRAASKLWSLREDTALRPSLICADGRVIQSADEVWF